MRIIYCSQKLLKEIKLPVKNSEDLPADDSGLGSWYCDVFSFKRKKYMIFTNENTLYSFFVYSVGKDEIESIPSLFTKKLSRYLKKIVDDDSRSARIISEYKDINFCRAENGSIAESMDYFIKIFESRLEFIDEVTDREILIANLQVNTTPMAVLNYASPLRKFRDLIDKKYPAL